MDFRALIGELGRDGGVAIESTDLLAAQVHKMGGEKSKAAPIYNYRKRPRPVSVPLGRITTSPAEVLHELGGATTFFVRSPFSDIARNWAHVRYCSALTWSDGWLALSAEAEDVVYHHKVMQSEQLGIGFGLVAARKVLQKLYPRWHFDVIDADAALVAGQVSGVRATSGRRAGKQRPDYFLVGTHSMGGSVQSKIWVLECKGTHASGPYHIEQLAKACVQVETVEIGTAPPPALMVATKLAANRITTYVLDPPGEDELWSGAEEEFDEVINESATEVDLPIRTPDLDEMAARRGTWNDHGEEPAGEESADEEVVSRDPEEALPPSDDELLEGPPVISISDGRRPWFLRLLTRSSAASALLYAGDPATAALYATRRQQGLPDVDQMSLFGTDLDRGADAVRTDFELAGGLTFRGIRYSMSLPDGRRLVIDRGIESGLDALLRDGQLGRYLRAAGAVRGRWLGVQSGTGVLADVSSVGSNGTALRISLLDGG
ncbi:hypothetical protein [Frankia sp. AgKG'84/4]|uniref:hypothetical protein n=1 Tax=Frankia sp. AgKG'84/4 TaxID=573490 RepID=UPI00200DD1FE|nr:hypothetical protein [Frankia sp. AgKG'84/4]MCL9793956.1 hypothetical protein [Frankia sp. AgKG'84/4]